ncbi:MAG TPA: class I poly(R)-hydroxyalkanoic acid synthase, partial [Xanthobacteraceae bacterium]|nr:class I poly(R)-hydroxyalkanoic acid synthase [Xanthobacteraceae bacterium]
MAPAKPAAPIEKQQPVAPAPGSCRDIYQLAKNTLALIEQGGKAMAAYLRPRQEGRIALGEGEDLLEVARTLGELAGSWLRHPQQAI